MSRWISTNPELVTLYSALSGHFPTTFTAQIIFEFKDGIPIAAMLYDFYNDTSIHIHMWVAKGQHPSRVWWWAVHDYAFRQLRVKQAVAIVAASRRKTVKFVSSIGGILVAILPQYCPEGDAMVFMITEESARFWQRYRLGIRPSPMYKQDSLRI